MTSSDNYKFKSETYNGISIIRETTTGYVNASQMCSDNNKRWRAFKQTQRWNDILNLFEKYILKTGVSEDDRKMTPSFEAKKGVKPEFQGEYVHPKLVHYIAEYISIDYSYQVQELMDSIDTSIHKQLEEQQLEDNHENSHKLFLSTCETIISLIDDANKRGQQAFEQQYTYGIRDVDENANETIIINNAVHDLLKYRESMKVINHPLYEYIEAYRLVQLELYQKKPKTQHVKDMLSLLE